MADNIIINDVSLMSLLDGMPFYSLSNVADSNRAAKGLLRVFAVCAQSTIFIVTY